MAWATRELARSLWPDAASIPDATLDVLLETSTEQCSEYAPILLPPFPRRYEVGCVYQARELYAAAQRGEQDVIGFGDFALRARPLTAAVKSLLRPTSGRPVVG